MITSISSCKKHIFFRRVISSISDRKYVIRMHTYSIRRVTSVRSSNLFVTSYSGGWWSHISIINVNRCLNVPSCPTYKKLREHPKFGRLLSHDLAGKWTIRVERVYRIIYEIDEENKRVVLMTIKHRKRVY